MNTNLKTANAACNTFAVYFFSGLRFNISLKKNCYAPPAKELQPPSAHKITQAAYPNTLAMHSQKGVNLISSPDGLRKPDIRSHSKTDPPNILNNDDFFLKNIFTFVNTSINFKKEVKRQNKKDCVKLNENKIESVSFYSCDRKLRNFNVRKNNMQNAGNGVVCTYLRAGYLSTSITNTVAVPRFLLKEPTKLITAK